jgi:hypothetical protein
MNEPAISVAICGLILTIVAGKDLYRSFQNLRSDKTVQTRQIVVRRAAATGAMSEFAHYAAPSVDRKSVSFWAF